MKTVDTLIFLYHNIIGSNGELYLYDVSLKNFKEQMAYLCSMQDAMGNTDIIITFDDGYKSWANEVLDLLKSFNLRAYFFVCIKNLERRTITKADIKRLRDNEMIIGSHSVTHRFLHTLPETEVFYELNESKRILEDIIQKEVKYCSIPRGVYTTTVIETAKRIGYHNVFTSKIGVNRDLGFLLKRIPIRRYTRLCDFKDILNGKIIQRMAFNQKLKDTGKRILGIEVYNWVRRILVPRAE